MSAISKAPLLLAYGYSPIMVSPADGLPHIRGWDQFRSKPAHVETLRWWAELHPNAGLAVVGGFNDLVPIDIDSSDPELKFAFLSVMPWPKVGRFGSKGAGLFYRGKVEGRNFVGRDGRPLVEVKRNGVLTIPPTLHRKTGLPYRWMQCCPEPDGPAPTLFDTHVSELPEITQDHLVALEKALARWCPPRPAFEVRLAPGAAPVSGKRMHALAVSALRRACEYLQGLTQNRNIELLAKSRALGKFVHHKVLDRELVERELLAACKANGSLEKHGLKQCGWTIASGFKRAAGDALPQLKDRPYNGSAPVHA